MSIYVGNLSYDVTQDDLSEVFSEYGTVKRVQLPTDRETGRPRGFGFVEAEDVDGKLDSHEAQGALRGLSEGLHPVAPSSTLDARLREELQTNHTWVEAL